MHKIRPPKKGKGSGKPGEVHGHTDEVLCLALSDDDRYLASGGRDRRLGVWDAEKATWIKGFIGPMGHKDAISVRCLDTFLNLFLCLYLSSLWFLGKRRINSLLAHSIAH